VRLGILGGTFDPVHVGHLAAAVDVRHALSLDEVLLVVAREPWQKAERAMTPAEDRFAVVEAAVDGVEGITASRIEIDRGGTTYTADTLEWLTTHRAGDQLFLIIGADVADDLHTWERSETVRALATLVVVNRPGEQSSRPPSGWRTEQVTIPALAVSSTDLRDRARTGRPLDYLVPTPAMRVIRARGLYLPAP
jgi:nicotinate-nucleotide adenylyltransferase